MSLTVSQISQLQSRLLEEREKMTAVQNSLDLENSSNQEDRSNVSADVGTDAIEEDEQVRNESLRLKTSQMLDRINAALRRIDDGSYGVTTEGIEIPYERLMIDPTATTIVE